MSIFRGRRHSTYVKETTYDRLNAIISKAERTPFGASASSPRTLGEMRTALLSNTPGKFAETLPGSYSLEVLLPDRRPSRWLAYTESGLTAIRDLSVFAPVAYTWWRLSQVLPAYHGGQTGSFISDWAAGAFPQAHGVKHVESLGTTALTIVGLISGIIFLTLVIYVLAFWSDLVCDLSAERQELAGILPDIDARLSRPARAPGRAVSVEYLENLGASFAKTTEEIKGSLAKLGEEIRESLKAGPVNRLAEAVNGWAKAVDGLVKATEILNKQSDIITAQMEISKGIRGLIAQIQSFTKAATESAQLHRGVGMDMVRTAQQLAETLAYFEGRVATLHGALQAMNAATRTGRTNAADYNAAEDSSDWDNSYDGLAGLS
jgi:hypothetical protein